MPKIDLREYKKEIRSQMRRIRREMSPQTVQEKNDRIYKRLIATQQYRRAKRQWWSMFPRSWRWIPVV